MQIVSTKQWRCLAASRFAFDQNARVISGFTLIELLVVISIITLLVSILLPSLNKARELAKGIKCRANLKTMSASTAMYSENNGNFLPPNDTRIVYPQEQSWAYLLQEFWGKNTGKAGVSVTTCPSDDETHWSDGYWYGVNYAMNLRLLDQASVSWTALPTLGNPIAWEKINSPSTKILYVDSYKALTNTSEFYNGVRYRHGNVETEPAANYAFCDGHVDSLPEGEISPLSIYYWDSHDPLYFLFAKFYYWDR